MAVSVVATVARVLRNSSLASSQHTRPSIVAACLRPPHTMSLATTTLASKIPIFKSKFVGVTWHRPLKKWRAQIGIEGKVTFLGDFYSEEEAARAYDERAASLGRLINFPGPTEAPAVKRGAHGIASPYNGVSWNIRLKKWVSNIRIDGRGVGLGTYTNEKSAARAYDDRAGPLGRPVNFPVDKQEQALKRGASRYEGVQWNHVARMWEAVGVKHGERQALGVYESEEAAARAVDDHFIGLGLPRKNIADKAELRQASVYSASKYVGVARYKQSKRWYAEIFIDGKVRRLGTFDKEEDAARAFDARAGALGRPVNFPEGGQVQAVKAGSSKYRGVVAIGSRWRASIKLDGKFKSLGYFSSEEEAARKFDEAAGPLGRAVNFPQPTAANKNPPDVIK